MNVLILLALILFPSLAWAQAGFLQAVPGTGRPMCSSITAPVANQTWCADATGEPGVYLWKVWNGTMYVTVGGGGGGGTPSAPVGSLQFNNAGIFGGANILYATAFGFSTSNTAAANATALNAAITSLNSQGGGRLLLPAGTFPLNTTTTITETALIEGNSTILVLPAGQTAFTIGTSFPVYVRNITVSGGARAVLFSGSVNGTGSVVEDNIFVGQTTAAVDFNSDGNQWTVRRNIIQNTTASGLRIGNASDSCECVIEGNAFANNTGTAAINWLGGGDVRIVNNKFNGAVGSSGAAMVRIHNQGVPTSEVLIADNVISNGAQGVLINGTVDVGRITIVGNQINSSNANNIVVNTTTGTSDIFIVANHLFGGNSIINLVQADRIFVESNAFLANAAGITAINIAAAASHASIGINKFSLIAPGEVEVANASGTTEFLPGRGTTDQIVVWNTTSTITGYAGFRWLPLHRIFSSDQFLTIANPSGGDVDAMILGSGAITIDESDGPMQFTGTVGSAFGTLNGSSLTFLGGTNGASITGVSVASAVIGNDGGAIDVSPRSVIMGSTSGTITNSLNAVVIGGSGGSVTGATNAVSINSGAVTTDNTTAVGGSILNFGTGTTLTVGAGLTRAAVVASDNVTLDGTTDGAIVVASLASDASRITRSFTSALVGSEGSVIQQGAGQSGISAIVGALNGTLTGVTASGIFGGNGSLIDDGATFSATLGGTGTIGTNCVNCVTVGNGSVGNSSVNAVAIGGGAISASVNNVVVIGSPPSVSTNDTVAIGTTLITIQSAVAAAPELIATGGVLSVVASNHGQQANIKQLTEELTIAASAFTDSSIQFPANALPLGVSYRVTVVIPTAATFDTGVAGATTRYGTGTSAAANTTGSSAGTTNPTIYGSATSVRITPNATPGAATGKIRLTIYYIDLTPPTS